jgi:putative ABC transport system permease protein
VNDSALPEASSDASEPVYYQLDGKAPTWAEVLKLNKQGIAVISSAVLEDLPPYTEQPVHPQARGTSALVNLSLILILLLIPVLVLSSSAFAFGARRQTRTLAVMASLGATRGTLLKVNLASGVWLGLLAGGVGTSFGVLASFIVSPHIAKGNWTSWSSLPAWVNYPGFHVPWDQVILLAAASILIGVWASLLPALRASKVNILATLRGTRTESEIRVRNGVGALIWLLAGVGGIVVAVSLISAARLGFDRLDSNRQTLIYIGGLLALLSGFATLTGFIVGSGWVMRAIATVTARMGKTANYAGRDLIFNRSRYAPVLSSVLVVYFLGTLLLGFGFGPTYSTWSTAQKQLPLMPGQYISIQPLLGIENVQGRSDVTLEELLKYQPSSQRAESESRLIFNTGAFTDVTVINSTVDLAGLAPRSPEDGSWLPQLNTPSPVIEFNPNNICYHSALSPKSPEFWAAHSDQNEVTPADLNQPPGCLNALEPNRTMVVGGADDLRAILRKTDPVAEQVLASGGVVLFSRLYDFGGKSRLTWVSPQDYSWEGNYTTKNSTHTEQLTSYLVPDIASESFYFTAMISEEAASKFGIQAFPTNILANANGPISIEVSDQLQGSNVFLDSFPNQNLNPHIFAWVIVALAGLFSLSAISIALGLSQIEAKADKRTLAALGAPKPFRSGMVATQAFTLAIMGAVLGGITGIAVGVSVVNAITPAFAMVPWVQLFTLVVLIPVLAAFGFWVFSPRKLKFENRLALD